MEKEKTLRAPKAIALKADDSPKQQLNRLYDKLAKAGEKPNHQDVTALRQLLFDHPEIFSKGGSLHATLRGGMIEEVTKDGASKALMLSEVDHWQRELGYDNAPALECILMENIVTCRLRLAILEFGRNIKQSSIQTSEYHDRMLDAGHLRLNKAVESLARVRLLATRAPVFQVNVATRGGQQVNVAGTMP